MDAVREFRKHADECARMARAGGNIEDRAVWLAMAERWRHCAEQTEREWKDARSQGRTTRHRRPDRYSRTSEAA